MTTPAHLFLFITGNPMEEPASITSAGHFTMNTETGETQGNITIKAVDNSWITHASLLSFEFDDDTEMFSGTIGFTTIKGNPPFPATVPAGPFPIGELFQNQASPNIFTLIAASSPPPV